MNTRALSDAMRCDQGVVQPSGLEVMTARARPSPAILHRPVSSVEDLAPTLITLCHAGRFTVVGRVCTGL